MVRTCHCTTLFHEAPHATVQPAWFVQPAAASAWPLVAALAAMGEALCEGLAACREYEELRSRGMPHDTAIRASLGLGSSPQQRAHAAAKPLYFAGKA
jgi:hypothetical protein